MTPTAILAAARAAGVTLTPDGDSIRVRPAGKLPADVRAALVAAKPEVLDLLNLSECNIGRWDEGRSCTACGYIHGCLDNPPCTLCGRTDLTLMLVVYGDRFCGTCRPKEDLRWER